MYIRMYVYLHTYIHTFCLYIIVYTYVPSLEVQLYILVCALAQHMEYQPEAAAESTPTAFSKVRS